MARGHTSRALMHSALRSRCGVSRSAEAAFEEWFGIHPLDDPEYTGGWERRANERARARSQNARAGKRIAYICSRESRARTKSTAQLRYEAHDLRAEIIEFSADPNVRAALTVAREALTTADAALADEHPLGSLTRAKVEAARRNLISAVATLTAAALASCDPRELRELAEAEAALAERLAETAAARRERLAVNTPAEFTAADLAPILDTEHDPPPLDLDALTRRLNLSHRPTVELLTRALALAPGAPSVAVCA